MTLPLIAPGVIAGGMLAFAKAMGEFGATITFVSNIPGETQTSRRRSTPSCRCRAARMRRSRLVVVSVAIALAALLLSEWVGARVAQVSGR